MVISLSFHSFKNFCNLQQFSTALETESLFSQKEPKFGLIFGKFYHDERKIVHKSNSSEEEEENKEENTTMEASQLHKKPTRQIRPSRATASNSLQPQPKPQHIRLVYLLTYL